MNTEQKPKVIVLSNRSKVSSLTGRIVISEYDYKTEKQIISRYYPNEIRSIIVIADSSISKGALSLLADKDVIFMKSGKPLYYLVPFKKVPDRLVIEQKLTKLNNTKKRKLAFIFCKGACINKIYHARRIDEYRDNEAVKERINKMRDLQAQLIKCKTVAEMRAIEANVAHQYFSIFRIFLPKDTFKRRNRHDGDIMNVIMNAAHSLIRKRVQRLLWYNGINSYYGFLHWQEDKRKQFLSFDFAELWLPYVDRLCFYGVLKGVFKDEDRINAAKGVNPYWLSKKAWQRLYELVYDRINDEEIQAKIDEFHEYLLNGGRFTWKVKV